MTNTLNGALQNLGQLMANNLQTQGVDDAYANNGLTTLANKILDISGGGESGYTDINQYSARLLAMNEYGVLYWGYTSEFNFGDEVGITAVLNSTKYVDNGMICVYSKLTGATIKIIDGQLELTGTITDGTEEPFFKYTPQFMGEHNIQLLFEGTDNYPSCSAYSTITINPAFQIKTDKIIADINNDESVNISVYYGYESYDTQSITLSFKVNNVVVDTVSVTTDTNGFATYSFTPDDDVNYDISASVTVEVDSDEITYNSNEITVVGISENRTTITYQNNENGYVNIGSCNNSVSVDWNDESSLEELSNLEHTYTGEYAENETFTIDIYGLESFDNINWYNDNIVGLVIGDKISKPPKYGWYTISSFIQDITFGKGFIEIEKLSQGRHFNSMTFTNIKKINIENLHDQFGLQSISLPNTLRYIGARAMESCDLRTITIPSSVTYMGDSCLQYNSNLNSVTFEGSIPPIFDGDIFGNYTHSITIYVPSGSLNNYINTNNAPNSNNYTYIEY